MNADTATVLMLIFWQGFSLAFFILILILQLSQGLKLDIGMRASIWVCGAVGLLGTASLSGMMTKYEYAATGAAIGLLGVVGGVLFTIKLNKRIADLREADSSGSRGPK